jgi:hypothetical protein
MRELRGAVDQAVIRTPPTPLLSLASESDGTKHHGPLTNTQHPITMNYDGAEGLEVGGGNTKLDPSVVAGQL